MKNSYSKKTQRKVLAIKDHEYAPEQRLAYPDAIALVRKYRREAQYDKGQYVLEQICRQINTLPEPQLYLMNVYLDAMKIDEARELVEQLLKKFPRDSSVLNNCASFYLKILDTESALALLDRAAAIDPKNDKIHAARALAYRAMGMPQDAAACYRAALKRNPLNVTALCGDITPYDNPMEQPQVTAMMAMLEKEQLTDIGRAELHFGLATAFSRADTEQHFRHLQAANKIVSKLRPFNAQHDHGFVEDIIDSFTQAPTDLPEQASRLSLSPVFIAAMPRSGTTMLEQMLGCHSAICSIGESTAFSIALQRAAEQPIGISLLKNASTADDLSSKIKSINEIFLDNYFVRSANSSRMVDKSIDNVYNIGNILTVFPQAKIIDLRRHPLDVIYSCYQQFFASGHNYAFDLGHLAERYKNYHELMNFWHKLFPERILSVSYETLVRNPEAVLRHILDSCGLEWQASCLDFHQKPGVVNTASREQVRRPLYQSSLYKWKKVEAYLKPAAQGLGDLVNYQPIGI